MNKELVKSLARHDQMWASLKDQHRELAEASQMLGEYLNTTKGPPKLKRHHLEAILFAVDGVLDHVDLLNKINAEGLDGKDLTMGVKPDDS